MTQQIPLFPLSHGEFPDGLLCQTGVQGVGMIKGLKSQS